MQEHLDTNRLESLMSTSKPDKFASLHRPWAQAHANASHQVLDLFRDAKAKPRLLLHGWPHPRSWTLVVTVPPQAKPFTRPAFDNLPGGKNHPQQFGQVKP